VTLFRQLVNIATARYVRCSIIFNVCQLMHTENYCCYFKWKFNNTGRLLAETQPFQHENSALIYSGDSAKHEKEFNVERKHTGGFSDSVSGCHINSRVTIREEY
jgi:hypothetical protein